MLAHFISPFAHGAFDELERLQRDIDQLLGTGPLPSIRAGSAFPAVNIGATPGYATVSFGRTSLKHWIHVLIAGIAAVLFIPNVYPVIVIALAALLGILLIPNPDKKQNIPVTELPSTEKSFIILLFIALVFFATLYFLQKELFVLASTMAWIDMFAFGGGLAALPLMFQEVVVVHSWLDSTTFLNGLALGQVTPGPIVITATFVGFLSYGFWGGVVATFAIFIPSFLFVVGTVPYYDHLRSSQLYQKLFQGILFSFVGLLLSVTIKLALAVPWSLFSGILASGAFLFLLLGIEILWVVIAGIGIALFMFVIGY